MKTLLQQLVQPQVVINAIKVAVVVGTLLNVINQWQALLGEQHWRWGMALLNYLVPFSVASYSAARQRLTDLTDNRKIPHEGG
ncbi:nitrate/nitrite transporter NrtS [Arsukibacterium sp.]|uniref:nitrate/nitrite transporter NrtS n=1 Tax=Arsukibacterium sp. TaxID=1977258 RepID=UPI003568BD41